MLKFTKTLETLSVSKVSYSIFALEETKLYERENIRYCRKHVLKLRV